MEVAYSHGVCAFPASSFLRGSHRDTQWEARRKKERELNMEILKYLLQLRRARDDLDSHHNGAAML